MNYIIKEKEENKIKRKEKEDKVYYYKKRKQFSYYTMNVKEREYSNEMNCQFDVKFTDFISLSPYVFGYRYDFPEPIVSDTMTIVGNETEVVHDYSKEDKRIDFNNSHENNNSNPSEMKHQEEKELNPEIVIPQLDNDIYLETNLLENNSVEIEYKIPSSISFTSLWIGLYDYYQPDNKKFLYRFESIKQHSHHTFTHLKRGKYTVRLFINDNNNHMDFIEQKQTSFIIGPVVLMTNAIHQDQNDNKTLEVNVYEKGVSGWIGIYNHQTGSNSHNFFPSSQYQLCSHITNTFPLHLSITHLPEGVYDCRFFTKESASGILYKSYLCSGCCSFSI